MTGTGSFLGGVTHPPQQPPTGSGGGGGTGDGTGGGSTPPTTPSTNYTLVSSQSTIQVLSPTVVQDVVVCSIQTHPSQVIATLWVTRDEWDGGNAPATLDGFAANIETVMASPEVLSASSGPTLDASGLQSTEITFVVGYKKQGSPFPPATIDVSIPANQLRPGDVEGQEPGVQAALATIDAAYQQLVAAAGS